MEAVMREQNDKPVELTTGYFGIGAYVRRVHNRFGPRLPEWQLAFHMLLAGLVLIFTEFPLFDTPSFSFFRQMDVTQQGLGAMLTVLGALRLAGLVINGARREVTPWIRMYSALAGLWIWALISICFLLSGVVSLWIAIYPVFAVVEAINMHRASVDAGEAYVGTA